jgi:anti-sigma factor RsiW
MDNDRLEILMGKFVDGEIEPSEQRLLDTQLAADPQSRRLFEEFKKLHALAQSEIAPLAESGRSFETVFACAWKKSQRGQHRIVKAPIGVIRFISGMAAGLLLAVLVQISMRPVAVIEPSVSSDSTLQAATLTNGPDRILMRAGDNASSPVIKDVDYYYYTDENGQRWLIEGFRENMKTQLVSYQDL